MVEGVKSDAPIGYFPYGFGGGDKVCSWVQTRGVKVQYTDSLFTLAS